MLLDLINDEARAAGLRVLRKHFYEFMLELHQSIHGMREERPVEVAANTLADEVDVLCFDEFQITDVQDATILPRLFEVLFLRGVVIVMTSNTSPPLLYSGGLNRHVHLPAFVSLLGDHCTVLGLKGFAGRAAVDYRRRAEATEAAERQADDGRTDSFFSGVGAEECLRERWNALLPDGCEPGAVDLSLPMGRRLRVPLAAGRACLVSFEELCSADRGEADFYAIAKHFDIVLLRGVPKFGDLEAIDEVRRFVKLLDILYDQRVRLAVAAAAPLDDLFERIRNEIGKGDLAWRMALYSADGKAGMAPGAVATLCEAVQATERAESRLREMRTRGYWESCGGSTSA